MDFGMFRQLGVGKGVMVQITVLSISLQANEASLQANDNLQDFHTFCY